MEQKLFVKKVSNQELDLDFVVLTETFRKVDSQVIDQCPWEPQFPYKPKVEFQIVHSSDYIGLHYVVEEEFVRAEAIRPNENVFEDSCVEFFLSLDQKQSYYNFEFNVLGTGLIGYGPAVRSERKRLSAEEIERVKTLTQIKKINGHKVWEIFLVIPKALIKAEDLSDKTVHANFYKIGDKLPNPHYLSWNNIINEKPNFHLPSFFGELTFE